MSIFSAIADAAHTFVNWFEKEILAIKKVAPTLEQSADAAFKYASAVIGVVVAQLPTDSEATKVLNEALSDIKVVSAAIYDAGAHPNFSGLIQTIVDNLDALLKAGHISNQNLVSIITKVVKTIAALIPAFLAVAPIAAA